jgi:DNA-3-methyladenine glycosylase II
MEASLPVLGPLDVPATLDRYRRWGADPTTWLEAGRLCRAVRVGGRAQGYSLRWTGDPDRVRLTVRTSTGGARAMDAALAEVRRLCGLDADLAGFAATAAADPVLAALLRRCHGLRPTLGPAPFETLVGVVCAQQVNLAWAFTTRLRLVERFGEPVRVEGRTVLAFPSPARLARARPAELRALQFTTGKAECIVGLARAVADGALALEGLAGRPDREVVGALTALRGLGRWTAEWFLARGLGRADVCPAGDLGVRKAVGHYYHRGRVPGEAAVRRRARRWRPHRSLAVHYLLAGHRLGGRAAPAAPPAASGRRAAGG